MSHKVSGRAFLRTFSYLLQRDDLGLSSNEAVLEGIINSQWAQEGGFHQDIDRGRKDIMVRAWNCEKGPKYSKMSSRVGSGKVGSP